MHVRGTRAEVGNQTEVVPRHLEGRPVNSLIYIIGLIVVIIAILSFFGLR